MKQSILILASLACLGLAVPAAYATDTLFLSQNVITMERGKRSAQPLAVAITGERISWIGPLDEARQQQQSHTKVIDLGERALLPGFIDAHGHISSVGIVAQLANVASPPVGPVTNMDELVKVLQAYISNNEIAPGEWVVGRGYDDSLLAEGRHPTRDDLDRASSEHPIMLIHVSGHLAAANSRALARAGINDETPNPDGGVIRRYADSNRPNGVLEETAASSVRAYMMEAIKDPVASIKLAMDEYAKNGITTAQDGGSSPQSVALLKAADQAGYVNLDVIAFPQGQTDEQATLDEFEFGSYQGRIKIGGIKLMLDGSPQGKTAYMTKPYFIAPNGQTADYRGYPIIPQPRVSELVKTYFAADVPVIAHANGDAAADMLIQAVSETAYQKDHRTVMIHAQTVREDQLTAMKTLGMVPSYFAAHSFYWGDWHRDSVFGVERATRISPTASTVARAMWFTVHNDSPVVPPDVMRLLWATTNRLTRSDQVLGSNQRIAAYDALRAVTINAAYQHFEEDLKGSIEVGKQADLVVLSTDPLSIPASDLLQVQVEATYSRGRKVF